MADFTQSKGFPTAQYPVHAEEASGLLRRCEPLLTPAVFKRRHLLGVNLTLPNGDVLDELFLRDLIVQAQNETEVLLGRTLTREKFRQKAPFDYQLYKSYIHIKTEHAPICSIERLSITSADGNKIFELPPQWIETSNFHYGQVNVVPLLAAYGVNSVQGAVGNAGIAFLTTMDGLNWVPAYWQVEYTSGLSNREGSVPVPVNRLVGVVAAIMALGEVAKAHTQTSVSISQDGIGQSASTPGPQVYAKRVEELTAERDELVRKIKGLFAAKFIVGNF